MVKRKYTLDELSDVVMPFGKHRGKKLDDVPLKYLDWLIGQKWLHGDLRECIEQYLEFPVIAQELEKELEQ